MESMRPFIVVLLCTGCSTHTAPAAVGGGQADAGSAAATNATPPPTASMMLGSSAAASGDATAAHKPQANAQADPGGGMLWQPKPGTSWQIQFSGTVDTSVQATAFDVDLFDIDVDEVGALHAQQRKVICYFDAAYEPDRPDSMMLAPYRGKQAADSPDQYALDIRSPAVRDLMTARLDLAKTKQCDGVDVDDVDVNASDSGFPITDQDRQGFIIALSDAAHARGIAFGLRNDPDDVSVLVSHADFAVEESCIKNDECDMLAPFVDAGKPVFEVEYADATALEASSAQVCATANSMNFDTLIKDSDLDGARVACR